MTMIISKDKGLIVHQSWQDQYEELRAEIIGFCQEQFLVLVPAVVLELFECIEGQLLTAAADLADNDDNDQWTCKDQKSAIELWIEKADDLIDFGDNMNYGEAIQAMQDLRDKLEEIKETLPG